jgi:membrane protein
VGVEAVSVRSVVGLAQQTYHEWRRHRTIRLGAGLAYYGLFAFVPLLAISLSVAGIFFAADEVQEYIAGVLADFLDSDAEAVSRSLAELLTSAGTIAGLGGLGLLSLAFTASLVVLALQDALNTVWEVPVRSGVRQSILRRLLAFGLVFAAGGVLMVSFAINAITGLIGRLAPDTPAWAPLTELVGTALSWALGIGVLALLFRYLADVRAPWPSVLVGSTVTGLFVAVGTVAIGAYLRRYAATSLVGVTGSVFLVLLWIYYEAQIVLAGAEFTRVLATWSLDDDRQIGVLPGEDAAGDVGR